MRQDDRAGLIDGAENEGTRVQLDTGVPAELVYSFDGKKSERELAKCRLYKWTANRPQLWRRLDLRTPKRTPAMKAALGLAVLAMMFVAPCRCFALWEIAPVSTELAKEMGMEVRSERAGPNHLRVELAFKTEGALKNFTEGELKDYSRVELQIGGGDNPPVTAPLRENRSKPGRIVVNFTSDQAQLGQLSLWVMVPGNEGGTAYVLRVKDFVEPKKDR